ncbi:MAG: acyl-CoA thioesterase [Peptostreptococcales bacterium]
MKAKTVEESMASMGSLMHPGQGNPAGNIHGGEIIKLMDNTAGIVAYRHARTNVVTARVDQIEFLLPVHIGDILTCNAKLTFISKQSMEIMVTALVEELVIEPKVQVALTALFTMVALDEDGNPTEVPPLELKTEEEKRLFEEGQKRYLTYKAMREERKSKEK